MGTFNKKARNFIGEIALVEREVKWYQFDCSRVCLLGPLKESEPIRLKRRVNKNEWPASLGKESCFHRIKLNDLETVAGVS